MLITVLLILHGLAGVILIGATTHQSIASWKTKSAPSNTFFQSLINTRGATYTNAIVVLYILTSIGGGIIYPTYVMDVKGTLTDAQMFAAIGAFELKEHYAIVGLAMLPTYWYLWRKVPPAEHRVTRALNTTIICAMVWTTFLIGHILNNIKGLI